MALAYFTVTGSYTAVTTDLTDADANPDTAGLTALVQFTPSVKEVRSPSGVTYAFGDFMARLQEDGQLYTLDDHLGVPLPDNTSELGPLAEFFYTVYVVNAVWDAGKGTRTLKKLRIDAPGDGSTVDLSEATEV